VFFRVKARRDTIVCSYKKQLFILRELGGGGGVKKKKKSKRKRVFQKPESPPAGVR